MDRIVVQNVLIKKTEQKQHFSIFKATDQHKGNHLQTQGNHVFRLQKWRDAQLKVFDSWRPVIDFELRRNIEVKFIWERKKWV